MITLFSYMARKASDSGVEAAVVEALCERADDGMTIFELRHQVPADIDAIEDALESLKHDGLIETDHSGTRVVIRPSAAALDGPHDDDGSVFDRIRERLPL